MRTPLAVLALSLLATPALAQFPPPGVYDCVASDGARLGTLNLFAAGDYDFLAADGTDGKGQVASAGTSVNPLSGPLKEVYRVTGVFATDATGDTVFRFDGPDGFSMSCALPPL